LVLAPRWLRGHRGVVFLATMLRCPLRYTRCMPVTEQDVITMLKQCYDPEIPVNIVDLGLIYGIKIVPPAEQAPELQEVEIEMTMTSPGCPAHASIGQDVKDKVEQLPGVKNAKVHAVWNPPWGPERLSEEAKRTLGIEV